MNDSQQGDQDWQSPAGSSGTQGAHQRAVIRAVRLMAIWMLYATVSQLILLAGGSVPSGLKPLLWSLAFLGLIGAGSLAFPSPATLRLARAVALSAALLIVIDFAMGVALTLGSSWGHTFNADCWLLGAVSGLNLLVFLIVFLYLNHPHVTSIVGAHGQVHPCRPRGYLALPNTSIAILVGLRLVVLAVLTPHFLEPETRDGVRRVREELRSLQTMLEAYQVESNSTGDVPSGTPADPWLRALRGEESPVATRPQAYDPTNGAASIGKTPKQR